MSNYLKRTPAEKREEFRAFLVEMTGCTIHAGRDGKVWPCGTCAQHLFSAMGLDQTDPQYIESNELVTRHNEIWRGIIQIRNAKL